MQEIRKAQGLSPRAFKSYKHQLVGYCPKLLARARGHVPEFIDTLRELQAIRFPILLPHIGQIPLPPTLGCDEIDKVANIFAGGSRGIQIIGAL